MPERGPKTVGDYVTLVRGTTYSGNLVGKPGPALLGLGSIEPGGGFRSGKYKTYGGECPRDLMLFPGELYASLKGATKDGKMIGSVARVPDWIASGRLTQDTVKLKFRHDSKEAADYLYWILRSPQYRDYCEGHATGSAVVALSRRDFLAYPVPDPSIERRVLVMLLEAIEKKLELHRRRNETLEGMARALFKDWFIDFGPVRAKMEGREPYLDAETWALFPNRLDDSGKPEGWETGRLDDLLLLQRGFDLPVAKRSPGPCPVIAASGPHGFHQSHMVSGPGVITGRSGIIGRVFYVDQDFWPLNTTLWVKEFRRATPLFAFHVLSNIDLKVLNAGSAVPSLNRNHVHPLPMIVPPGEIVAKFEEFASALERKQRQSDAESEVLSEIRDTLLPKLISGELRIPDPERFLAEHVAAESDTEKTKAA